MRHPRARVLRGPRPADAVARDRFLVELDDAIRPLTDPVEVARATSYLLADHMRVERCTYADVSEDGTLLEIIGEHTSSPVRVLGHRHREPPDSLFVRALLVGTPFVFDDLEAAGDAHAPVALLGGAHVRSLISAPIKKDGLVFGAMTAYDSQARRWTEDDVQLLQSAGVRCGDAIERVRLTQRLMRKTRFLSVLAQNGVDLLAEERPATLIDALFERASDLLGLDVCLHYVVTRDRRRLRLVASRGVETDVRAQLQYLEFGQAVGGAVTVRQMPLVYTAVQERSDSTTDWIRKGGLRAYAAFPLVASGDLVGTVSFGTRTRDAFDLGELEFLGALSDQVAAAYARASTGAALRESEDRMRQAVAIAGLGTFETNLRTDAVVMNAPGRDIYGFSEVEALTFSAVQAHFHPDDRARVMHAVRAALDPTGSGAFDVEHRIVRTDGAERWVRIRGQAVFEQGTGGRQAQRCIGTYLDITDRKLADDRRERVLRRERAAREEAERVGLLKDEFLATLSHELRTPLNAILGWSQVLRRGRVRPENLDTALAAIDRNAHAQAQLIGDLLDMSRIVSGTMRIEVTPVEMALVVRSAIESIKPAADTKRLTICELFDSESIVVMGDAARLQQVVWNLLSNAVKFTAPGGEVQVALTCSGAMVDLSITDTGIGITTDFLPYVFERFRQQDASATRHHGGLGLGLSIVKQLVELHGGSVRAHSEGHGRGASFQVALPVAMVAHAPMESVLHAATAHEEHDGRLSPPRPLTDLRVLVVDDEADARSLLVNILESAGATVRPVGSADAALSQLSQQSIDVLISDIGMPDVDGYELIRRVRTLPDDIIATVPAVALTAYARAEDRERVLDAGYQVHLAKPLRVDDLIEAIMNVARRPQSA